MSAAVIEGAEALGMEACVVYFATELGNGDELAALETEAVYDAKAREFVLTSPHPRAYKLVPTTGGAVPELAVVMARLISLGQDRGVFPFIVRIRERDGGPRRGIRITPLAHEAGYATDSAVARFEGMRIPKAQWVAGGDNVLHDDGRFETTVPRDQRAAVGAMGRV